MNRAKRVRGTADATSTDRSLIRFARSAALLLFGVCGCVMPYQVGVTETGAPQYEHLAISYRIEGTATGLPPALVQMSGAPGGIVDPLSAPYGDREPAGTGQTWTTATLRVEYPHPEGEADLVRATLRLSRGPTGTDSMTFADGVHSRLRGSAADGFLPSGGSGLHDEVWVLDFPRQQLDLMLIDLAGSGFFDQQQRPKGNARLSVTIDRGQTAKPWSTEPRLDDLIRRVQREGWLVGFTSPEAVFGDAEIAQVGWME